MKTRISSYLNVAWSEDEAIRRQQQMDFLHDRPETEFIYEIRPLYSTMFGTRVWVGLMDKEDLPTERFSADAPFEMPVIVTIVQPFHSMWSIDQVIYAPSGKTTLNQMLTKVLRLITLQHARDKKTKPTLSPRFSVEFLEETKSYLTFKHNQN